MGRITLSEYKDELASSMPEKELQEHVRQLAVQSGALFYHTWQSQNSPSGFPDCVILTKSGRLIFAELKRENTEPTAAQEVWIRGLATVTDDVPWQDVCVWRPSDLLSGEIDQVLGIG